MPQLQISGSSQLGRAAGYPDFSSMSTNSMTPVIYSQKTLIKFYKKTFLTEITNNDYEGEISGQGDKVIIRSTPDMTIKDYVIGQDLEYETPESASVMLEIDKAKYYAFNVFTPVYVMTQAAQGTGGITLRVLVYDMYLNAFNFQRIGYASAEAFVLFLVILVLTLVQFRLIRSE